MASKDELDLKSCLFCMLCINNPPNIKGTEMQRQAGNEVLKVIRAEKAI